MRYLQKILFPVTLALRSLKRHGLAGSFSHVWRKIRSGEFHRTISNRWQNESGYAAWRKLNEPTARDMDGLRAQLELLTLKPLISIITPCYNTPEAFLHEAVDSVLQQIYPHWQLCVVDDCSSDSHVSRILQEYSLKDARISPVFRTENGHISAASNSAIEVAKGEYIAFLDHDDTLTPDALLQMVVAINHQPRVDFFYSDEDKLDATGQLVEPRFKPVWSPDTMLSWMYTCHFAVYRTSLVRELGGLRTGFEGSQDYDLVLRVSECCKQIRHVPGVLYHWRVHPGSAADSVDAKSYAGQAGLLAIQDALNRRGEGGNVIEMPELPLRYLVRYKLKYEPLVSVIVCCDDPGNPPENHIERLLETGGYPNTELLFADSSFDGGSEALNSVASIANGDYLLFLDENLIAGGRNWLTAMLEQAQRPSIGAVGVRLLDANDSIRHAGLIFDGQGSVHRCHEGRAADYDGYFGNARVITNFSGVSSECMLCSREHFKDRSGFDNALHGLFADVDLCLGFLESGLNNVYLPHVSLQLDKATVVSDPAREQQAAATLAGKWRLKYRQDPYYSCNLDDSNGRFEIRTNALSD